MNELSHFDIKMISTATALYIVKKNYRVYLSFRPIDDATLRHFDPQVCDFLIIISNLTVSHERALTLENYSLLQPQTLCLRVCASTLM